MNSFERIIATLGYKDTDQIPVLPVLLLQGAKLLNMSLPSYLQTPKALVQGQTALVEKYGHDGIFAVPCFTNEIQAFGGELVYSEFGPPCVGKMAWKTWKDMETTRPIFIQHPALLQILQTTEMLASQYKGKKIIVGAAIAPFTLPSILIGTEKWMELLWEDELIRKPMMNQCLNICYDFCVQWANAQLSAGADIIVLADGMASATCITREQFESMALPYIKNTVATIHGPVAYEAVGYVEPFLDLFLDTGVNLMLLECQDDVEHCKKIVGNKIAFMGNLNNIEMIHWTKEQTEQKCQELLQKAGNGFILSTQGPEVPWDIPDDVIMTIIQSAKNWKK